MPAGPGDAAKGRRLFLDRNLGPCTGCHLVQGEDVWPAGSVGPDLSAYGDRNLADQYVFDMIYDPRHLFPQSVMPPWGTDGVLKPEDIVDVVAFLKTQKSPLPAGEEPGAQSGHPAEAGRLRRQPRPHEQSGGAPRRGRRRPLGDEGAGGQGLRRLPRGRAGGGDEGRGDPLSPVRGPVSARDGDRGFPGRARSRDHGDGAARRERGQSRPDRARQDGLERHAAGARPRRAGDTPPPSSAASARSTGASASATTRAPTATRRRAARAPTSSSAGGSSPMSRRGSRGTSRPGARARPTCGTCASACSGA